MLLKLLHLQLFLGRHLHLLLRLVWLLVWLHVASSSSCLRHTLRWRRLWPWHT